MTRTFITHATLLDGERPGRDGMTVVVEGNRITVVAEDHEAPVPESNDRLLDATGHTVMPGLFQ